MIRVVRKPSGVSHKVTHQAIIQTQQKHGVQRRVISVDNFFVFFEIIIFCFVVAICDLVHNVETIFHLSYVLTASGILF